MNRLSVLHKIITEESRGLYNLYEINKQREFSLKYFPLPEILNTVYALETQSIFFHY